MRYPIWKKDDFFVVGGKRIDMDPSVVTLEESVPLGWWFRFEEDPVGRVNDIRLEDGEITGEVELFDLSYKEFLEELLDKEKAARLGGYYNEVTRTDLRKDNGARVVEAHLRYVGIVLNQHMPGARVQ